MFQGNLRVCVILLIVAGGCSRGSKTIPVQGTVKLDGRPLANASVSFIAEGSGARDAFGCTDAEGVFHLSTLKSGDGALPGKYKVTVQPVAQAEPSVVFKNVQEAMTVSTQKQYHRGITLPRATPTLARRSSCKRCPLTEMWSLSCRANRRCGGPTDFDNPIE